MKDIYSDIWAETVTTEVGSKRMYLYDATNGIRNPNLVLPNMEAIKRLRNYLNAIIKEEKK